MKKLIIKHVALAAIGLIAMLPLSADNWVNFSNFSSITDIAKRNSNEVWVAAKGGLVMHDLSTGTNTFFKGGPNQLPSLEVERVVVDPSTNDIWIGTYDNGIARYNGNTWEHYPYPSTDDLLYEMKIADDGTIWCATTEALYKFSNGQYISYRPLSMGFWALWDIELMADGRILCGGFAPYIFDPSDESIIELNSSVFSYSNSTLAIIDEHRFAFGSGHQQLAIFTDTTETDTFHLHANVLDLQVQNGKLLVLKEYGEILEILDSSMQTITLANENISAFLAEDNGDLWTATSKENGKLYHLDAQSVNHEISIRRSSISSNYVKNFLVNSNNELILLHSGIEKFDAATEEFVSFPSTPTPGINEMIELNGKYYAAMGYGYIYEYTPSTGWQQLGSDILPSASVYALDADPEGNIWLCGYKYIAKYDGNSFEVFNHLSNATIPDNLYPRDIYYDEIRDMVWVATYSGIIKIEGNNISIITEDNTPAIQYYDAIHTIEEDKDHNIWFGTVYGGLIKYDGNGFELNLLNNTSTGNRIVTDIEFRDEMMYVSDNISGIWTYESGVWTSFNTQNSLLTEAYVNKMIFDANGNLWIAHNNYGVDIYNANGIVLNTLTEIEGPSPHELEVYPNPSHTGLYTLKLPNTNPSTVYIYSMDGKLISKTPINGMQASINISNAMPGVYLAEVRSKEYTEVLKLIIE